MSKKFDRVLSELQKVLGIPLHIDETGACSILLNDLITLQLEIDPGENYLIIGSYLIEILPGRFREMVLKAALKANYGKEKGIGSFSYIPKTGQLFLFESIPLSFVEPEQFFPYFHQLANKAAIWKGSLVKGVIPSPAQFLNPPFGPTPR